MKKVELLSPVGNIEMLKQAIHNGCDAVYLGGKKYGSRAFANNFSEDELIEVIKYCHLYGVKIYVTINTVVFDREIDEFVQYVKFLYDNSVDAVIMQDLGMIVMIKTLFPNLEIHASTQCHNHNEETVKYLKKLGVHRAVLARELSLAEINKIDCDIEKEVFIHGALCVCYSGCCLFSSMNGSRSGNRGECVASCRLPYKLIENDKEVKTEGNYLLSTKELNSLDYLKDILASGVTSLKIEGRMKSAEYVGYVTRLYRRLIDDYYNNKELVVTEEEIINLQKLFNRKFTKGFLSKAAKGDIINIETPNHRGIELGRVIDIRNGKIKVLLNEDLNQEDGIRFLKQNKGMIVNKLYDEHGKLVNKIEKGHMALIDNKIGLKEIDTVLKTTDVILMKSLNNFTEKKIGVSFKITAHYNQKLELTIIDDSDNKITRQGNIVEASLNKATTEELIVNQIKKLGNTPFVLKDIMSDIDSNIFIPIKEINDLRRFLCDELKELRSTKKNNIIYGTYKEEQEVLSSDAAININILVRNEHQLLYSLNNNFSTIYVTDYKLYNKYRHHDNIYYRTSRLDKDTSKFNNEKLLVTELGALNKYSENNTIITDYYLNVVNYSSYCLLNKDANRVTLSAEFKDTNRNDYYNAEVIIYGRIELMIMKYCPLNYLLNDAKLKCNVCKKHNKYYLKDQHNNLYPILNENNITHILHYKNINLIEKIKKYRKMGITNFRIELFDETEEDIIKIVQMIEKKI